MGVGALGHCCNYTSAHASRGAKRLHVRGQGNCSKPLPRARVFLFGGDTGQAAQRAAVQRSGLCEAVARALRGLGAGDGPRRADARPGGGWVGLERERERVCGAPSCCMRTTPPPYVGKISKMGSTSKGTIRMNLATDQWYVRPFSLSPRLPHNLFFLKPWPHSESRDAGAQALQRYFAPETLAGSNAYKAPGFEAKQRAVKQVYLEQPPEVSALGGGGGGAWRRERGRERQVLLGARALASTL
jgi:hypothetical protein